MAKKVYGLKAITMGDPALDGGMGLTLIEVLGETVKGSASLVSSAPESTEVETEEVDDILEDLETKGRVWTLAASTYKVTALTMQKFFGGTIVEDIWSPPVGGTSVQVNQSVMAETKTGIKFRFVKMKLVGTANFGFDKTKLGQIDWTGKVLSPDKAATPAMSIDFGE